MTRAIGSYGKCAVYDHFFGGPTNLTAMGAVGYPLALTGSGVNYVCANEGTFVNTLDEPGGVLAISTDTGDVDNFFMEVGMLKPVDGGIWMECRFKQDNVLLGQIFAGFSEVLDPTTPVMPASYIAAAYALAGVGGVVGFLYDPDATTDRWLAIAGDAGIEETIGECGGQTMVNDEYDVVRVEIDQVGTGRCWLAYKDGSLRLIKTFETVVTPTDNFYACLGIQNSTAAARNMEVDYFNAGSFVDWER